mmetsp:Transcript_33795/g.70258  ORF Transcript_33795/g.70258 Transcript_33795/m.70258 type:complete len:271 (-) Transcript_33795:122-934(-)|eukprot:CAMPEP_0172447522 /NCGR_PEP_ID=MMETSP1065-20121228/6819_1 /TAXON_ID=265537 /ORGANISM="Amphiprora paludosa, Strain CCMP125" /LENGTH=270 /DNA_ID=CAMNT_0013198843 /DNA_START=154 /DNA_END=966 /DNA_ORIENTATION=+
MKQSLSSLLIFTCLLAAAIPPSSKAFVIQPQISQAAAPFRRTQLHAASPPDIKEMRVGELKKELESYGISTKSFLEKREMVEALEKARAEGQKPIGIADADDDKEVEEAKKSEEKKTADSKQQTAKTQTKDKKGKVKSEKEEKDKTKSESKSKSTKDKKEETSSDQPKESRSERLQKEMEKAKQMKVGELRSALKERGIRTTSFFEKSEFVRAYAEAIVDGTTSAKAKAPAVEEEPFDPSFRDVTVRKMDKQEQQRLLMGGKVIDVQLKP